MRLKTKDKKTCIFLLILGVLLSGQILWGCVDDSYEKDIPWTHSLSGDENTATMEASKEEGNVFYDKLYDYGRYVLFLGRKEIKDNTKQVLWAVDTENWRTRNFVFSANTIYFAISKASNDLIRTFGDHSYNPWNNNLPYKNRLMICSGNNFSLLSYNADQTLIEPTNYPCGYRQFIPFPDTPNVVMVDFENWEDGSGKLAILDENLKEKYNISLYDTILDTFGQETADSFTEASISIGTFYPYDFFWLNEETFIFSYAHVYNPDITNWFVDFANPTFIRFSGDPLEPEAILTAENCPSFGTYIPNSSYALLSTPDKKTPYSSCLIDFDAMEVVSRLPATQHLAVAPNGRRLVLLEVFEEESSDKEESDEVEYSYPSRWQYLDFETLQTEEIPTDFPLVPSQFSPDGKRLLARPNSNFPTIYKVYNFETKEWNNIYLPSSASEFAFTSDGNELYLLNDKFGLKRYDLVKNTEETVSLDVAPWLGEEFSGNQPNLLFGVNEGKFLLLGFENTWNLLVFDTESQEIVTSFELP